MVDNSKIEWTDHTFNPWIGCTKVSPGCKNCYAERLDHRMQWTPEGFGKGKPRKRTSEANWKKPLAWNRKAEKLSENYTVFPSLCDPFDKEVPIEWLTDFLLLVQDTPNLTWLLLTKRPELVNSRIVQATGFAYGDSFFYNAPNVWVGISAENQETYIERAPSFHNIGAKKFLSLEPLLGKIYLRMTINIAFISWVIVGGESGPGKRPFNPDWARSIRDQCKDLRKPFFMKQIDKVQPIPDDLMIREFPVQGLE